MDESPSPSPSTGRSPDVDASVKDLADSLGVDADGIELVSVEQVTWRNGSRGCARPGEAYTQALVNGRRITLRVGGRTYEYHSGGSRPPTLCEKPTE